MYQFTLRPRNELIKHCARAIKSIEKVCRELPDAKRMRLKL
jgi:hypothetical protein